MVMFPLITTTNTRSPGSSGEREVNDNAVKILLIRFNFFCIDSNNRFTTVWGICFYLRVGIQYADPPGLNHFMYGVDLESVQVAVVLSVFQIAAVLDVRLHLAAAGESVHALLPINLFGLSGGVWIRGRGIKKKKRRQTAVLNLQFLRNRVFNQHVGVVLIHGMVAPKSSGSLSKSLFISLRRPTPWAPIRIRVFLLNAGTLATSS